MRKCDFTEFVTMMSGPRFSNDSFQGRYHAQIKPSSLWNYIKFNSGGAHGSE